MNQTEHISLLTDLAEYLLQLHERNRYFKITPDRIRYNRKGYWSVVGKSESQGSIEQDILYLGATLHYLMTGKKPAVDCLLDGFSPFPNHVTSSYPGRFLRIVEKILLQTGKPGNYGDAELRDDIAVLKEEIATVQPGNAISENKPEGFRYTRNYAEESARAEYIAGRRYSRVLWGRRTPGTVIATPCITATNIFIVTKEGIIASFDRRTGETIWMKNLKTSLESSPVMAGEYLYFGSDEGRLLGVDALTGTLRVDRDLGDKMIRSASTVMGNNLLIGSGSGYFYCLNLPDLEIFWSTETGGSIFSSAATDGATVWFGSDDGMLYALSLETGELVWKYQTGDRIRSSPVQSSGNVYIGSFDGFVYSFRARTGTLNWKSNTGARIYSSPAVHGGKICIGSNNGSVNLFSGHDGKLIWRRRTHNPVASSPLVLSRTVYIGSDDGHLYGFDIVSGRRVMRWKLGSMLRASPLWFDGCLYSASTRKLGCSLMRGV